MAEYHNLAEHTPALLGLMGIMAGIIGFLFWRMIARIEEKLNQLCERTISRHEFEDWKEGRQEIWDEIRRHRHGKNASGKEGVII